MSQDLREKLEVLVLKSNEHELNQIAKALIDDVVALREDLRQIEFESEGRPGNLAARALERSNARLARLGIELGEE